ncbi:MAG: quinolinate synthase [Gammaproteobacteria bacterium]|nr:quinolinate synthase [Gammaproteobacteria bacterium]
MNYQDYLYKIKDLLITNDAKIVAHYYVDELVQQLAEDTGGFVSDSLEMARYGMQQNESTLIVAGVKFMGETAKILNPDKKIFMPDMDATCSLDLGCDYSEFKYFCDQHPDREVVVYANTSAKVKSIADWVVTSSIALPLVEHLTSMGKKIIWAPDKYLGNYILDQTGADMILWDGSCIVHEEYKTIELKKLKELYPESDILVHPESPRSIIQLADVVGSTTQLIEASKKSNKKYIIVATEKGIFYQMKKLSPDKIFMEAPTEGEGATCKSCGRCPWMNMNSLDKILNVFNSNTNEIKLSHDTILKAKKSIDRMISFRDNKIINKAS